MKRMNYLSVVSFLTLMLMGLVTFGQSAPAPKKLVFPTNQESTHFPVISLAISNIQNAGNAITSDLSEYSTVNIIGGLIGSGREQVLKFPSNIPAGTVVKVKVSLPDALLSLIPVIAVQKMNGSSTVGSAVIASDLLSLISSPGNTFEIPVTVGAGETVNGVRIRFSPAIGGLDMSMNIYGAYYEVEETNPANVDCSQFDAFAYTSGANQTAVGNAIGELLGSVSNPERAFDGDITTYATMNRGLTQVAGNIYLNGHFLSNGVAGDQIRLTLSSPATLLDVQLLSSLKLVFYGDQGAISSVALTNNFIFLDLLAPAGAHTIQVPAPAGYNRVGIEFDNLLALSLFDELRVHDFRKIPAQPNLQIGSNDTLYAYVGTTVDLEATPTLVSDEVFWYDSNNQQVHTGTQYTTPAIQGDVTYKVLASRYNCILDASLARIITILTKNVTPNVLGIVNANESYADALAMEGVDAQSVNYLYTLISGILPLGLTLNPDGTISGTTTDLGVFPIEVQVQDLTNGIDAGVYNWELEVVDPLNLNLVSFTADWNTQKNALLTWETVSTSNIEFFNVQKSIDGKNWETMAQILSNDRHQYTFEDVEAQSHSSNYYRLELVEDRGTSFSKVVQLLNHNVAVESPMVYPNPANQWIQIQHAQALTQVSVYNLIGQLVYKVEQPTSSISLDHLSAGQYMIVITDANGQVFQQKIMKQ